MQVQLSIREVGAREVMAAALLLVLVAFALSSVLGWFGALSWHDEQRIWQLGLLTFASMLLLVLGQARLPASAFVAFAALLGLGLLSALLADWPMWALKEWGRYAGLVSLALLFALYAHLRWFSASVLGLMAAVGCVHALQFIVYYASAFLSGIYMLDVGLLFNGFVNPRFFGQFQLLLMPVLAALVLLSGKKPLLGLVLFTTLALHWCIAMALGGRGLWLGIAVSTLPLLLLARRYWSLVVVQLCAGLVGALLFALLLRLIPAWLGLEVGLRDVLRGGLSGREQIWLWAWEMAQAHPWLGVGPMHYSASYNPIAAHPHQVVLQWLAEWGMPATLLALLLGTWGMCFGFSRLRHDAVDHIAAALWLAIAGALVLAQVDGVFVMPYTETWLAILIGLAMGRWGRVQPACVVQRGFFMILAIALILIMANVLINEVPTLARDSEAHMAKHQTGWTPRFWQQGWIPMDADSSAIRPPIP